MRPSSAKAKGRRAVQETCEEILKTFPQLQPDDVRAVPTSVPGEDLWLSPAAAALFPYSVEAKNVEKLNIWSALEQAKAHSTKSGRKPMVVFRRNGEELHAVLPLKELMRLVALDSAVDNAMLGFLRTQK